SELDGVTLHRMPVGFPRDNDLFGPLHGRVITSHLTPLYIQREWMRQQGPELPGLAAWLAGQAASFDVVCFFTYLYDTAFVGLPIAAGLAPTVFHPTAHDEPPIYLALFDLLFRLPTAYGFLTEEEEALVTRRFRIERPSAIVGLGIELAPPHDEAAFRATYGIGDRPYLLYVGRVDPGKGSEELVDYFITYKNRSASSNDLVLVVVGEQVHPIKAHEEIICTGFVDDFTKDSAMAGALALVHPSYYESFSLVLAETWALSRPALVQGHCDVLVGQAQRSEGAIPYEGFAQFEAAVDLLRESPSLCADLGFRGRRYVTERYDWDTVLDRYEQLYALAASMFRQTSPPIARATLSR
ncbi:MAG TPA: glycosyltransferase, partial [Nocardioides sp.]|nr:glycosyltransferase [Nocardioides sp.]